MPPILQYLLSAAAGYLLGNFNTGLVVSRLQSGIDIRKHGSGNAGTTNMLRVLGALPALLTFVGDVLKGWLAVGVGTLLAGFDGGLVAGTLCIAGHNWPVFFGFKGGKGVATTVGLLLLLYPLVGLFSIAVFLVIVLCTRYVSLGSVFGALFGAALLITLSWGQPLVCVVAALWCGMIAFCHRANIQRLLAGTESKLSLPKSQKKEEAS
jgi:glycerol-3-phosphate acyltransferase PlsY